MKPRRENKRITKADRRRQRNRLISILTAAVVFFTTYAMVLPAITMEEEVATQEPGIVLEQPAAEVPVEPAAPEPVAAEPLVAEPVAEPAAVEAAPAETVVQEEVVPAVSPEEIEVVTPEPAVAEDANTVQEDPAAEPAVEENSNADEEAAIEDPASEEEAEEAEEETEEEEEENKLAVSPLVFDGPDYVARVSFGPEAALPEGTMLLISEYGMDSNDYLVYKGYLFDKLRENGVAEENLEEAVAALRLFGVVFKDKDGVRILPASAVDVEFEYKDAAQVVTDETLHAATFRTDDGQPTKATLIERNSNGLAAVEAPYGFIQKLYVQAWQAQDYHTNPVIGQVMLRTIEKPEEATEDVVDLITTEDTEEQEEIVGVGADSKPVQAEDGSFCLYLTYGPEAGIPEDAKFVAIPVTQDHPDYAAYKERTLGAVEDQPETKPVLLGLFDLTIYDANDNVINPKAPITIRADLGNAMDEVEDVYAVHFVDSSIVAEEETATAAGAELEVLTVDSADGAATFEADGLSVIGIVGTEIIEKQIQTASGDTLKVTVEVNNENDIARLEGLRVDELNSDSDKYWEAYNAVVEAKAAEDENFDEETLGFFAADIDLLDANGEAFEPDGSVKVTMELISLPADENTLVSTMEVQHLEEKDGNLDVQTVATSNEINKIDEVITAEFSVDSFSTFTLTWTDDGSGTIVSDDDAALTLNLQESGSTYATVRVHYVGKSGDNYFNIERPAELGVSVDTGLTVEDIEALLAKDIEGFTYLEAHVVENNGDEVTSLEAVRTSEERDATGVASRTYQRAGGYETLSAAQAVYGTTTYFSNNNNGTLSGQLYWHTRNSDGRYYLYTSQTGGSRLGNNTTIYYNLTGTQTYYTTTVTYKNEGTIVTTETSDATTSTEPFVTSKDIYLVYESQVDVASATVHFGTLSEGTFTEFDRDKVANIDTSAASISLANNFSGVSYLGTSYSETETYSDNATTILPNLYKTDAGWEAIAQTEGSDGSTVQTRFYIADGSHIFVCYTTDGGSNPSGVNDPSIPSPETTKTITPNGDGTYSIQLDVQGTTVQEDDSHYANVLIVLDATTSMRGDRWTNAKLAIDTLISTLTEDRTAQGGKDNSANANKIDFSLVTFGQTGLIRTGNWGTTWTKDNATFKAWCASDSLAINTTSGTNWESGLYYGYDALTQRPDTDPTYVIFVTDGDPYGHGQTSYTSSNDLNANATYANNEAYDIAHYTNTSLYGIFTSESAADSNASLTRLRNVISNNGGVKTIFASPSTIQNEFAAIAETILNQMGASDVSVDDGITQLSSVSSQFVGTPGGYNYYISYKLTVDGNTGTYKIGDTTYTVELTDSNVWHKTVDGAEVYYYKTKWDDAPGADFSDDNGVTWDLSAEGTIGPGVIYSIEFDVWPSQEALDLVANLNNGTVDYDDLEEDVQNQVEGNETDGYTLATNTHLATTYSFQGTTYTDPVDPFPSEEMPLASEHITVRKAFADTINSEDPFTSILFYLKMTDPDDDGTEKEGTFYYYQTDGSLNETLVTTGDVQAKALPVNTENEWKNSIFIAPGVMKGTEVLEKGHKYTLDEAIVVGNEYEYEFTPQIVRPMFIDGVLTFLVLVDEYNGPGKNGVSADVQTYIIDGETYYVAGTNDGELVGTNRKTAELDITKIVKTNGILSKEEEENESFTYRVTLQIPDDNRIDPAGIIGFEYVNRTQSNAFYAYGYHQYTQAEWEATGRTGPPPVVDAYSEDVERLGNNTYRRWQYLIYRDLLADGGWETVGDKVKLVRDENGNIQWRNPAVGGYHTVTYDMTLKQSELIRFTNLPTGTKYTIQEIYANKYIADNNGNSSGLAPVSDPSNIAAEGYAISVKSTGGSVSQTAVANDTVTGTISGLDTRYYNQFTNTMTKTVDVNLAGTKKLDGYNWSGESYHFTLTTTGTNPMPADATGKTEFDLTAASGSDDKTDTFGRIRFTAPGTYTYTVSETGAGLLNVVNDQAIQFGDAATVTIVIDEDPITHELSVGNVTGAVFDRQTMTVTASITNTAPTTTVTAKKAWLNADESTTPPTGAKVTFKLYANGEEVVPAREVELDSTVDGDGEATAWEATFSGLPEYKVVNGEAVAIEYRIGESVTWPGYSLVVPETHTSSDPYTVVSGGTLTNKQSTLWVQFKKTDMEGDKEGHRLSGAVFTFNDGKSDLMITSGNDGILATSGTDSVNKFELAVRNDAYVMTETIAPEGYIKLTDTVNVSVKTTGVSATMGSTTWNHSSGDGSKDNPYVLIIRNSSGVALPMTGGSGTLPYTLGGIGLIMASALMYIFRMRRRERRLN